MTINVNLHPLESTPTFSYLGCTIAYNNSDWAAVYNNLWKAQSHWVMVSGVLVKAGAMVQARVMFYKAVVQSVLVYRSEIWVIKDVMMKELEGFHNRINWRIAGKTERIVGKEGWECPRGVGPGSGGTVDHAGVHQASTGYHRGVNL